MIDFVVHSEKVESSPQGNKINIDARFLRSSINIIVTVVLSSNIQLIEVMQQESKQLCMQAVKQVSLGFPPTQVKHTEIQAIDQIS